MPGMEALDRQGLGAIAGGIEHDPDNPFESSRFL